jgi:two-component system phosphate regulon sensor histidine kinase PhoR
MMFPTRLFWQIYSGILLVIVATGIIIGVVAAPGAGSGVSASSFWIRITIGAAITTIVGWFVAGRLARRLGSSLSEMQKGVGQFTAGNFDHRVNIDSIEELGNLSYSLNVMALRLEEQRWELLQERNELEITLSGMADGILAIDLEGRLVNLNPAAAALFDLDMKRARGKTIVEIVRNTALQEFAHATLEAHQPIDTEMVIARDGERHFHLLGSPIRDMQGQTAAAVLVIHDITTLRRLETMRRDFVANVSHELKTPITSIKGYVETVLDTPDISTEDSRRFLETVRRQAERLNAIIDDLLSLSRIEQGVERAEISFADTNISAVLKAAVHSCEPAAKTKQITLSFDNPHDIQVRANSALLEQAVVNLVDNAIKYSSEGAKVEVAASANLAEIVIQVKDNGPGIPKEHLPRIFERFYRVDKSRSRDAGGTGLGLAIVKHIVVAHHGSVSVESEPGKGTVFAIRIPR